MIRYTKKEMEDALKQMEQLEREGKVKTEFQRDFFRKLREKLKKCLAEGDYD